MSWLQPREPTPAEVNDYLQRNIPLLEVPAPEVPFWDPAGVAVLFLLFVLVPAALFVQRGRRVILGGVPAVQGDLLDEVTTGPAAQTFAEAAAQITGGSLAATNGTDFSDWPTYEPVSSSEGLPPLPQLVSESFPVPPPMGQHLAYFVSLPWGLIFGGGVLIGGVLVGWSLFRRRRSTVRTVRTLLFAPAMLLTSGLTLVGTVYLGGVFFNLIAPPRVLASELFVYWRALFVPGYQTGSFSSFGALIDLGDLALGRDRSLNLSHLGFAFLFRSKWPVRVVAAAVALVLADHAVAVVTATTDLAEYERLLAAHRELSAEMARLAHERMVRCVGQPPDSPVFSARLQEVHDRMHRVPQSWYTTNTAFQSGLDKARDGLAEFSVPHRRVTLVDRAVAQAARLIHWVRRPG